MEGYGVRPDPTTASSQYPNRFLNTELPHPMTPTNLWLTVLSMALVGGFLHAMLLG